MTSGATEALGSAILAAVEPGDEVIIFTPAYDSYAPMIRRAGGTPIEVALRPARMADRPGHAPGRGQPEDEHIRSTIRRTNGSDCLTKPSWRRSQRSLASTTCWSSADEVWEHVVLDGSTLRSNRDVFDEMAKSNDQGRVSRKDFFAQRAGRSGGSSPRQNSLTPTARAHQFLTFSTAPNLQSAVAYGLSEGDSWLQPMRDRFQHSRDMMTEGLRKRRFRRPRRRGNLFPLCRSRCFRNWR